MESLKIDDFDQDRYSGKYDIIGVTYCLLCGDSISVYRGGSFEKRVCKNCQEVFKLLKERALAQSVSAQT